MREIFEFILKKYPNFLDAYHSYWLFLKKRGDIETLIKISQKAMEVSEHNTVPTSLWVETRILRAKTYIMKKDVEKAISTLKDVCYILTPFPAMNDLPFIDSVLMYGQTEDLYLSEMDEGQLIVT